MYKRVVLAALAGGLLAGCQSATTLHSEAPAPTASEIPVEADLQQVKKPEPAVSPITHAPVEVMEEPRTEAVEPQEQERNSVMILMKTSMGDIKLELDKEKAPKTVENFLSYVETGHYTGTTFHRVIGNFMIQGGGFDAAMNQKPAPRTVENEAKNGLSNTVGTIAMARLPDPHSASAQFFINVNDNSNLDYPSFDGWGYCVFGKVVEGMDVVNSIKMVPTGSVGPHQDVPLSPVMIESISVVED